MAMAVVKKMIIKNVLTQLRQHGCTVGYCLYCVGGFADFAIKPYLWGTVGILLTAGDQIWHFWTLLTTRGRFKIGKIDFDMVLVPIPSFMGIVGIILIVINNQTLTFQARFAWNNFLHWQLKNPYITGSCEARKPTKTNCYEIRDRKTCLTAIDPREHYKSPCGWCYGKNCKGSQNLCEPKKWLLQKELKLGQDYEDCLVSN